LDIKGLNLNLNEFIYGFDSMKIGNEYSLEESKPKLYNAMNIGSGDESDISKGLDKGKGVDSKLHSEYDTNSGLRAEQSLGENKSLDQSKYGIKIPEPSNPFMAT
jgi:hypothetical protein